MSKEKFYLLLISGLLLSNIALIVFAFLKPGHKHDRDHDRPRNIVIDRLELDPQQIQKYDVLIHDHRKKIKESDKQIHRLKNELYQLLADSILSEEKKDSLIQMIHQNQEEVEHTHFLHFLDIKALCKPEQIPEFNKLAKEISNIFAPPQPYRK